MKIGVALSGCGLGGVSAHSVLEELEEQGLAIEMISACSVPSAGALSYAYGMSREDYLAYADSFLDMLRREDWDGTAGTVSSRLRTQNRQGAIPVAINAVNMADGKMTLFTNDFSINSQTIRTFPLEHSFDALKTLSGTAVHSYLDCRLCDFSCWYGCPVHPLRMQGMEKTISVAFLPQTPQTTLEVLTAHRIEQTKTAADVFLAIHFPPEELSAEEYSAIATSQIRSCIKDVLKKILF